MKNKILASLLLVLLLAISASAVSASEGPMDAITDASDISSDLEIPNEGANIATAPDDLSEETIANDNLNADNKKLGDGNVVTSGNTIPIKNLNQFKTYVGTEKYDPGTIFKLSDNYIFNLTQAQNIKRDCTIIGGTIKAENLDYFFKVESPSNKGPSSLTIRDTTFIVTKNQNIILANGKTKGINNVLDVTGITLENITIRVEADIDFIPENNALLFINAYNPIVSNEINIKNNKASGVYSVNFANALKNGGDFHVSATKIVYKMDTKIIYKNMNTIAINTATDGRNGEYFNVTLTDSAGKALAGKAIQIGFNGKAYNRTTDAKGFCQLQINLPRVDIYTFAVCFLGDDEYFGSFEVACINVSAQKASLNVPNKSYAANAKTKSLTATYKSTRGNPIKGKKITFTVNGKSYTATTNANGVATVNVSLSKKGTYSFTAKYAGDQTYASVSKKAQLVIK